MITHTVRCSSSYFIQVVIISERLQVIGGSSVLNTMLYVRGNRRDYDNWASMGNDGWSYDEVLPYFMKSQDQRNPYLAKNKYHATGGYLTVQDSPWNTPLGNISQRFIFHLSFPVGNKNNLHMTSLVFGGHSYIEG